ncbi:MAG: efflux RND transporter periplasmic adaptor subunit, partial [Alistipes sp.]|nr:efflux RND transporter periplasmic adaptor subunit [Alistipes sp.]
MNKQITIAILVSGLSLAVGCSGRQEQPRTLPMVQTGVVEPYGESQKLEFPGRVKAAQEVNLAFKLAGTLQRFLAPEGTHVRQGDVLAQLDPRDYRLQLDAVEAEYRRIKAQAERVMSLYADSAATADDYDKARYGLRQIEAKYRNCKNQLADTELRAPFDGFVQRHLLDRGTVVGAGMPVVSIISGEAPEVEINIPGAEYVRRNEFAAFEGSFDFWPGRRIPLSLLSISPKANANQLYTVRL